MSEFELLEKIPKNGFISKKKLLKLIDDARAYTMDRKLSSLIRFGFVERKVIKKKITRKRYYPRLLKASGCYCAYSDVNYYRRIK